ncbi:integrase [Bacillus sp. SRB_336]|nr:integrase [Bacillus sp. SRB_336]
MTELAPTLQSFFTTHLAAARGASPHTIASYRDSWRLFICFLSAELHTTPDKLTLEELSAEHVMAFLTHLRNVRGNSARTSNARLAAIHSFCSYASYSHPDHADSISRVLAIPVKRQSHPDIDYLDEGEVRALLAAPPQSKWSGRRDHALLLTAITTGLRVSELTALTWRDIHLGTGAHTYCHGKGRKDRTTPLDKTTAATLRRWRIEQRPDESDPVFPTQTGNQMSTDAVAQRLTLHGATAAKSSASLAEKRLTPHALRHTTAMNMLHHGVDTTVIALWLGHTSVETTQIYIHADLTLKQHALDRLRPPLIEAGRFVPAPALLAFLNSL